jgi:hypothetical protein
MRVGTGGAREEAAERERDLLLAVIGAKAAFIKD